jgi:hypothetical protein
MARITRGEVVDRTNTAEQVSEVGTVPGHFSTCVSPCPTK